MKLTKAKKLLMIFGLSTALIAAAALYAATLKNQELSKLNIAVSLQNYSLAVDMLENSPWLDKLTYEQLRAYCNAMLSVQKLSIKQAEKEFAELGNFKDSLQQRDNAKKYLKACGLPLIEAYNAFSQLGDYADSRQKADVKLEEALQVAKVHFLNNSYTNAKRFFDALPQNYSEDAEKYIKICNIIAQAQEAKKLKDSHTEYWDSYVACVMAEEYGLVNVCDYIMGNHLQAFLNGMWRNDIGGYFSYDNTTGIYNSNIVNGSLSFKMTTDLA